MQSLKNLLIEFMSSDVICEENIYNEFSLQHELGVFLRETLQDEGYKVKFEKSAGEGLVKKEMDLSIVDGSGKYKFAIELKFPINGAFPEQMRHFVEDIKFMEQVKPLLGCTKTYCLCLVNDGRMGEGFHVPKRKNDGIYQYFRGDNLKHIHGSIPDAYGSFVIKGEYQVKWTQVCDTKFWYYLLEL